MKKKFITVTCLIAMFCILAALFALDAGILSDTGAPAVGEVALESESPVAAIAIDSANETPRPALSQVPVLMITLTTGLATVLTVVHLRRGTAGSRWPDLATPVRYPLKFPC